MSKDPKNESKFRASEIVQRQKNTQNLPLWQLSGTIYYYFYLVFAVEFRASFFLPCVLEAKTASVDFDGHAIPKEHSRLPHSVEKRQIYSHLFFSWNQLLSKLFTKNVTFT